MNEERWLKAQVVSHWIIAIMLTAIVIMMLWFGSEHLPEIYKMVEQLTEAVETR